MGTGSFPGVKRPRRGVDHPLPSSAEVKERVEVYLYSPFGASWPVAGWPLPSPVLLMVTLKAAIIKPAHNNGCGPLSKKSWTSLF
jgi:hypothetical protein